MKLRDVHPGAISENQILHIRDYKGRYGYIKQPFRSFNGSWNTLWMYIIWADRELTQLNRVVVCEKNDLLNIELVDMKNIDGTQITAEQTALCFDLLKNDYFELTLNDSGICALKQLTYTVGLFLGMSEEGYLGRYLYATDSEARAALLEWDGVNDPPGKWLKYYGIGGAKLNTGLSKTGYSIIVYQEEDEQQKYRDE